MSQIVFRSIFAFSILILMISAKLVFAEQSSGDTNSQVMQEFVSKDIVKSEHVAIEDQEKRLVMFLLGVPLLVFLIVTGILGVAMGVYGKQVFVAHMVFAGLSITLAIAHAIVGIVWFYPF